MENNPSHDELRELLERFFGPSQADSAEQDIRDGDRLFDGSPSPSVAAELLTEIKQRIAVRLSVPHKPAHLLYRYGGAAAAVIVVALIGFFGRPAQEPSDIRYASLIPAAIWDSDDIISDDMKLAYFRSELRRVEAQMLAIDADEGEVATGALNEVEMELIRIERQFWKE
ncbi:MAG: hypothetical protein QM570_21180 [Planctomycetota bacterium]|nr:hypothetical protein [Planctomycetota bacterium]